MQIYTIYTMQQFLFIKFLLTNGELAVFAFHSTNRSIALFSAHSATLFSIYSAMRFISAVSRIMRSKYLDCWFYSCGVVARRDATESKPTIRQYNIIYNHNPRHHSPQGNIQKNGNRFCPSTTLWVQLLPFFIEYLYIIYPERASWYPLQLHIPRRW